MKSLGHEMIDKETLRHIAWYKSMQEGMSEEIQQRIMSGNMFEDELN